MIIELDLTHKSKFKEFVDMCLVCHTLREETLWIATVDGSVYMACNRHIGEVLNDWIAPTLKINLWSASKS